MQLADVLILADKKEEAIALLIPLADQFARDGFAAKAVSVLKKIQRIDPGRRDVEERLARQIEERQREAVSLPLARPGGEPGASAAAEFDEGPSLEIGFEAAPISAPVLPGAAPEPTPQPAPRPQPAPPLAPEPPAPSLDLPDLQAEPEALDLPKAVADAPPDATIPVSPQARPAPTAAKPAAPPAGEQVDGEIEDYDLLYYAEEGEEEEIDVPLEAELVEAESATAEPMSAGQFADELMGLVDSVFQDFTAAAPAAPAAPPAGATPAATKDEPRGGSQIVVSPLFRDFAVDEMVAVIQGLRLVTHERGEVILREGEPGMSLYMLTSGRVRAFKKDAATGKQNPLGDLKEGAFFGEMSILTGQPRMASVVALSRCELLELDRPTLDGITKTHPHVWDVLREFAEKRTARPH